MAPNTVNGLLFPSNMRFNFPIPIHPKENEIKKFTIRQENNTSVLLFIKASQGYILRHLPVR